MKKMLLFLMLLCVVCVVAVSCGSIETPAQTTADTTTNSSMPTESEGTTKAPVVNSTTPATTSLSGFDQTPDTTKTTDTNKTPDTTKAPDTTKKPATTTRDPNEGWGDLIPIT